MQLKLILKSDAHIAIATPDLGPLLLKLNQRSWGEYWDGIAYLGEDVFVAHREHDKCYAYLTL